MTKTELYHIEHSVYVRNYCQNERRLYRCKAWYYEDEDLQVAALRSYNTIVAVYYCGVVWEFAHCSNTTTQHVRKFARLMDAPVVSLYRRSGMSKRDYEKHMACDWSDVIDGVLNT